MSHFTEVTPQGNNRGTSHVRIVGTKTSQNHLSRGLAAWVISQFVYVIFSRLRTSLLDSVKIRLRPAAGTQNVDNNKNTDQVFLPENLIGYREFDSLLCL